MSVQVIAEGRHGEVIIRRRKADGTVVLLACTEYTSPNEASGTTIAPDGEEDGQTPHDPPKGDGVFPMLESASDRSLVIDISEMPAGILQFAPERFSRQAIAMLQNGETETALDERSAGDFGYVGVLDAVQEA